MVLLKKNIFTVVEFSSSKVSCVIFHSFNSIIKILAFASESSQGIKSGAVSDLDLAVRTISRIISKAEQVYGKTIETVFVILSGCDIETQVTSYDASLNNREITEKDLKNLIYRATTELEVEAFRTIIHSVCNGYSVDEVFVFNPLGMYASKISVLMSFISVDKLKLTNITRVFSNCRLTVAGYIVASYADSFSCLSLDDIKIGATVINFGAETTSVVTYKNDSLISCYSRSLGSNHITFDIACAFSVSFANAEKLKILHGNLLIDDEEGFIITNGDEKNQNEISIDYLEFLSVIRARQEEIIESIFIPLMLKDKKFSYDISARKILITGGGSNLLGLSKMISDLFPCKLVQNVEHINLGGIEFENIFNPQDTSLSTIIGAIRYIVKKTSHIKNEQVENKSRFSFRKIFSIFK